MMIRRYTLAILILLLAACPAARGSEQDKPASMAIRVMAMNAQDIGSADLEDGTNPRLQRLAAIIQRARPNVLLLSEIAFDEDGTNASRFVEHYLAVAQEPDLRPIEFNTLMPRTNTGITSGFDLDRSGQAITAHAPAEPSDAEGNPARQTLDGRSYGNDCYGFGTYPGQYSMALFVDPRLTIETDGIRTFQQFLWKDLHGHTAPKTETGASWYSPAAWDAFRLSSKTFADVPVRLNEHTVVHFLISHPTPPAFDGPEARNKHRNRDEIRLIRAYIDDDPALYDDAGVAGGLAPGANFIVLGDLNADPTDGSSLGSPITEFLFHSPRLAPDPKPSSGLFVDRLDPTDTARFGLRVDYVLPSTGIEVIRTGIWRHGHDNRAGFPSDHFPVWAELAVPADSD